MQNDKPEPFNAGAETESGLTPEQEARDEELLTSLGKFLENAGALRVTLYAAQRADQRVTTGTPLVTLIIPADEVDTAFVLGSDTRNDLLVALATDGNLAVRIERGVAF